MDSLERIYCKKMNLMAYSVVSKTTTDEIIRLKKPSPAASYLLGQSINSALLMSATLKPQTDQNLTFKIECSGPVRSIIVQADAKGNVRATIGNSRFTEAEEGYSLSKTLGAGLLTVSKDIGLKEPYTGVSHLAKGDIAYDSAYYLLSSEQIASAMLIGFSMNDDATVHSSGGLLIQALPDTPIEILEAVEKSVSNLKPSMSKRLESGESQLEILSHILSTDDIQILNTIEVRHNCRCSIDVVRKTLNFIHREDLKKMIEEDKGAEISCTFCEKKYHFSEDELKAAYDSSSEERLEP